MEYRFKVKIKIISILILCCLILYMMNNLVTVESLLGNANFIHALKKTSVKSEMQVLDDVENVTLLTQDEIDIDMADIQDAELSETEDAYIVSGTIDSSHVDDRLNGEVTITHEFDKQTKQHTQSQVEVGNQLDESAYEALIQEVNNKHGLTEKQAEDVASITTDSVITIIPVEEQVEEITLQDSMKENSELLKEEAFDNSLKVISANNVEYVLGQTSCADIVSEDIDRNIKYHTNNGKVYGLAGNLSDINYVTEEKLIEELGEPMLIQSTKYWNVSIGDEEFNIVLTPKTIDILYKD